ncbi:unnamed protein product [Spirodela intermedia]|uniref:Uncharacterized protein n=1 Tax=Spirodela intermedia TaxID=51605 RepID=A0A7I8IHF7_SPIIN|nr:unnamed protein product [Spirodela intermedia]CAA6656282.1 unnamed protein product [Spirodela intermedia]
MDVEGAEAAGSTAASESSVVICQLADPEGERLGPQIALPSTSVPFSFRRSSMLALTMYEANPRSEEKVPYAFYISDEELVEQLGIYLQKKKLSVERTLQIVYQPQALFRIRPVNRCSATIAGHTEAVLSVVFSPDGRSLASGSEIIIWDPQTGKPSGNPFTGHKKWITGLSWEPVHLQAPCRRFVSSSKDGDARIWDITLRKCLIILTGHTLAVTCVRWGGDGMIYTSSQDCTIKVWETSLGKLIRELKGHGHWVNSLALSTEYTLRTGAFDHTCKQYSSPEEMKEAALARYQKMKGNAPERLVSGSDDFTMILWEPANSKHPKLLVNHVYFSPDGQWLASASFDKSVKLWNGITGKFITSFRGHVGPVYQISWSADSRLLLSGSKDSTLKVWDVRTRKLKEDLPGHADEVFAVDWSPDGEKVASGGKDRVLKLWMG